MHRFLESTAGQFMTRTVKTVSRDTSMRELQRMFEEDGFNYYPVREGEEIIGLEHLVQLAHRGVARNRLHLARHVLPGRRFEKSMHGGSSPF